MLAYTYIEKGKFALVEKPKPTLIEPTDAIQQPAGRVGNPLDIAHMVLFLCSDKAGFITGENICIDGGMTKQMIYHGDNGWRLES